MITADLADTAESRYKSPTRAVGSYDLDIQHTFERDLQIIADLNLKERVMVKWVFGNVVVREGEVLASEKDWLRLCDSYIATLQNAGKGIPHRYTIFWTCPMHGYSFLGGFCPGLMPETIVTANADIDAAISQSQDYRFHELCLHVGYNPRLRHELDTSQLHLYTTIPISSEGFLVQNVRALPAYKKEIRGNKRTRICSFCKTSGHNRRTCRMKKRVLAHSDFFFL